MGDFCTQFGILGPCSTPQKKQISVKPYRERIPIYRTQEYHDAKKNYHETKKIERQSGFLKTDLSVISLILNVIYAVNFATLLQIVKFKSLNLLRLIMNCMNKFIV